MFSLLEESDIDSDIIQSVAGETIASKRLLDDPIDVLVRINLLVDMRMSKELATVQAVVNRASKLASKGSLEIGEFLVNFLIGLWHLDFHISALLENISEALILLAPCFSK